MPGNLIYFSCPISKESLQEFGPVNFEGAGWLSGAFNEKTLKISQYVSMYQCEEKKNTRKEKRGEQEVEVTSWQYSLKWSSNPVDSSRFEAWKNSEAEKALRRGCGQ